MSKAAKEAPVEIRPTRRESALASLAAALNKASHCAMTELLNGACRQEDFDATKAATFLELTIDIARAASRIAYEPMLRLQMNWPESNRKLIEELVSQRKVIISPPVASRKKSSTRRRPQKSAA